MWAYLSEHALEIAGVVLGIIYLLQELKANRAMWITGMIMPLISLFVYFRAGLYADFAIDIYYFLIGIYGFIAWKRGTGKKPAPLLSNELFLFKDYSTFSYSPSLMTTTIGVLLTSPLSFHVMPAPVSPS